MLTVDEDVTFHTHQVKDANRDRGYKEVQTKGENGKRTVTYEITIRDGKEVARKETNSIVIKEAVEQVEVVGVKGMYTTLANESITWNFLMGKGLTREQTWLALWVTLCKSMDLGLMATAWLSGLVAGRRACAPCILILT